MGGQRKNPSERRKGTPSDDEFSHYKCTAVTSILFISISAFLFSRFSQAWILTSSRLYLKAYRRLRTSRDGGHPTEKIAEKSQNGEMDSRGSSRSGLAGWGLNKANEEDWVGAVPT